ncbi:MAG TPA: DUF2339 domain-containing protein [Opitutaceae bacterium]|nr:DUF2339 domain-containing protein [Opitutaceae bacterium]
MTELLVALLVLALVIFPIWTIVKIIALGGANEFLTRRIALLTEELDQLRQKLRAPAPLPPPQAPPQPSPFAPPPAQPAAAPIAPAVVSAPPVPIAAPVQVSVPPPLTREAPPFLATPPPVVGSMRSPERPAPPVYVPPVPAAQESASLLSRINWEQFMGAKLFAWLGGLAAFLGAAFFVKYSFEHDLIPPEVRVALGFLFGLGLIVGGLKIPREKYAITAQTLCATGVVTLYAVTFACNSVYHFAFFGALATFLLMTLITAVAFLLAVRMEAKVVAILGMLGGFLTPVLLSTGKDNPPGLFGYLALLDIGLVAVALHRRWQFLVALGAGGTVIMMIGWAEKFFVPEKALTAVVICLGFCVLFLAAYLAARRVGRGAQSITFSAIALPFVSFGFAALFLGYAGIAGRPGLLFTFLLLADVVLLALAWLDEELPKLHLVAGLVVFALLAAWTGEHLTPALLPWALAFYLLYAVLHTAFPVVLERHRPDAAPTWWSQLFPPLALLLMLGPLVKLEAVSILLWPCILLVDLVAIGLALLSASLAAVVVVLVLTLVATGVWIFQVPATLDGMPSLLGVIGGFAVLFFAAGIFLARRLGDKPGDTRQSLSGVFGDARSQLPAFSALLPFLLLIMMTQRLPLADPSPVFGLALLLVVLVLGLACVLTLEWLPACALAGVGALGYAWQARHFAAGSIGLPLAWFAGFHALFAGYPLLLRRRFNALTGPWAVAALSGVVFFPLIYRLVDHTVPNDFIGIVPALFAVPPMLSLVAVLRGAVANPRARLNQLAWYGGVALFFITLIFPIQFERQWITLGWALEGAALLWLFHRVPHNGLRATGAVLLVTAFARLALNPAVLEYHARSNTPLLNWYLYSYGLVIACLFAGARLLAPPREKVFGINTPPLFNALGTVLAFLLLNIQIADYFTPPGRSVLTFQFSGNFARDMAYTIGWALFALGLLLFCIWKPSRAGRYAALGLLSAALLKLFFHDLARLDSLYRIGALFAVAVIASLASFAYQRWIPGHDKNAPPKS